jgi:hypothetical protein
MDTTFSPSVIKPDEASLHNVPRLFFIQAWWIFAVVSGLYLILSIVTNTFVLTQEVYYRGFSQQMTAERIEALLELRSSYWWAQLISPFFLVAVKASFTALCLTVGIIISGQDIALGKVFKVALLAEGVFVLAMATQVLGCVWFLDVRVPNDYANFAPLSLFQFFDPATLKLWMKHSLRTVNLFEVLYCVVMAYFLAPLLNKSSQSGFGRSFVQTLALVVSSYGLGLLLWVVAVAFLLLQIS